MATTGSKHHDLNLRAAYVHVLADALTSVLAIGALCAALWLGWWWLDPLVGVLGAVVIAVWAVVGIVLAVRGFSWESKRD